jgi:hypothetical protein
VDDETKCKKQVWDRSIWRSHRCSYNVWKDGYCKIHHPDSVKQRAADSVKRLEERWKRSPWGAASARIKILEQELKERSAFASRYAWLRQQIPQMGITTSGGDSSLHIVVRIDINGRFGDPESLDSVIDAAMTKLAQSESTKEKS